MLRHIKKYLPICFRMVLLISLMQLFFYLFRHNRLEKNDAKRPRYFTYVEKANISNNVNDLPVDSGVDFNFSPPSEGSWQNVSNITAFKFLVYSAFLDIRARRTIRVIAVTKMQTKKNNLPRVWCKLWYKEGFSGDTLPKPIPGEYHIIKENWGLPYSAYYINCPIADSAPIPAAISVVCAPEQTLPQNMLKLIVNYDKATEWKSAELSPLVTKMAVCVKPLHYDYNRVFQMLEFIELHRLLGADHFFLYNHTVGGQVGCILDKYQQEGLVTILPWQLPIKSQKEIRTEGIFAALNDCLFRTMHQYSHSVFVDFDEFIIPTFKYDYRELFGYLHEEYDIAKKSAFSFKNAFFYLQWPDDPAVKKFDEPVAQNLIVLSKTTRKTQLHLHRIRSKLILRPDLVNMVGNHFVWEYYNKKTFDRMEVNEKDAFMHHYRVCEFGGDDCVSHPSTVDNTTYRYKDELIRAVKFRYDEYSTDCKLEQ